MVFMNICMLVLCMKVASALEGLTQLHQECTHDFEQTSSNGEILVKYKEKFLNLTVTSTFSQIFKNY